MRSRIVVVLYIYLSLCSENHFYRISLQLYSQPNKKSCKEQSLFTPMNQLSPLARTYKEAFDGRMIVFDMDGRFRFCCQY